MHAELNKVVAALEAFYSRETYLLDNDLGERALTHRLAVHVEGQFTGWEVDCEYDRLGERTLRMPHGTIVSTEDHFSKSIFPDIVVHQREVPSNLVAIEVRNDHPEYPRGSDDASREDRPAYHTGATNGNSGTAVDSRVPRPAHQHAGGSRQGRSAAGAQFRPHEANRGGSGSRSRGRRRPGRGYGKKKSTV